MAAEARTLASKGVAASYSVVTERAVGSLEAASAMEGGSTAWKEVSIQGVAQEELVRVEAAMS